MTQQTMTQQALAADVQEMQKEIDSLRYCLGKEQLVSEWWWLETRRLQGLLEKEASAWKNCRVTSPLTGLQQMSLGMSNEGWLWHHWETSCPCCKRPLDITVLREEESPTTPVEGSQLQCVEVTRSNSVPVYESVSCYRHRSWNVRLGEIVTAMGPLQEVHGYPMLPIRPSGAVDMRYFELLPQPPRPKNGAAARWPAAQEWQPKDTPPRYAYCAVIWGANGGYSLGAAALGARLRDLTELQPPPPVNGRPAPVIDRVLLHTDDVPPNFLEVLSQVWTLKQVDYIDGVEELYSMKGTAFDGVFTKLAAWGLADYDKVLLLDIDLVVLKAPHELFDLQPPAALIRGNGPQQHGEAISGRRFFAGEADTEYPWSQGGGINAGVILLRPCVETLQRMISEVTSKQHPEHIRGNGPEQDYLTRYFASAPWHHMHVGWNYQVHHLPYALEQVIAWRRYQLEVGGDKDFHEDERTWLAPRLLMSAEDVGIVHFSGDVKPWHLVLDAVQDRNQRRAVDHEPSSWRERDVESFGEHLLQRCCQSYSLWFTKDAPEESYAEFGCVLCDDGRIEIRHPLDTGGTDDGSQRRADIMDVVDLTVSKIRGITSRALYEWRTAAERFLEAAPGAVEALGSPAAPSADCFLPGTFVEALWPPIFDGRNPRWLEAMVVSVHADGRHVVRYRSGGSWGDTERGVVRERLRLLEYDVQGQDGDNDGLVRADDAPHLE